MNVNSWPDKLVYYFGGIGAFLGSVIQGMDIVTFISIFSILIATIVSISCQIIKTIFDYRYKNKRISILESLKNNNSDIENSKVLKLLKDMKCHLKEDLYQDLSREELYLSRKKSYKKNTTKKKS